MTLMASRLAATVQDRFEQHRRPRWRVVSLAQLALDHHTYAAEKCDALQRWGVRLEAIVTGKEAGNVVMLSAARAP